MDTEKRLGKAEALLTLAVDFLDIHAKENSGSSLVSKRIKEFLNNDSPWGLTYLYIHPYTGDEKIKTIKEVRTITNMGLKDSKELVEQGGVVMEGLPLQFARYAAVIISRWGANVEVKEGLI